MFSIAWRLVVLALCVPFLVFPVLNMIAIPTAVLVVWSLTRAIGRYRSPSSAPF